MKRVNYLIATSLLIAACTQIDSKEASTTKNRSILEATTGAKENDKDVFKEPVPGIKEQKLNTVEEEIPAKDEQLTKAYVSKRDSSIHLNADINKDHRIFGYAQPDTTSDKLLLLSVFTNDVEKNPFACELGAYYDTDGMGSLKLKYQASSGVFVKAAAFDGISNARTVFFERKWMEFE